MDMSVLWDLSYGVYAVGALDGERLCGCIANSAMQISVEPPTIAVSINKENFTHEVLTRTGRFTLSLFSEQNAPLDITYLGFQSGRERDKFAKVEHGITPEGLPFVTDNACGYLSCKVIGSADCHTHTVFLAEVTDAVRLSDNKPMTYDYYHKVIKGKTPKNAPTYQGK